MQNFRPYSRLTELESHFNRFLSWFLWILKFKKHSSLCQPKYIINLSHLYIKQQQQHNKNITWGSCFLFSQGLLSWMPIKSYQHVCVALLAADNCFPYPSSEIRVSVLTGSFQAPSKRIKETEILNIVTDSWGRKN